MAAVRGGSEGVWSVADVARESKLATARPGHPGRGNGAAKLTGVGFARPGGAR